MRRVTVLIIGGLGLAAVLGAAVFATLGYVHSTASREPLKATTEVEQLQYRATIRSWPFALASGDALPRRLPADVAQNPRRFVSDFYKCSWERVALRKEQSSQTLAFASLALWVNAPEGVTDGTVPEGWSQRVLAPAENGDLASLKSDWRSCDSFKSHVGTPDSGIEKVRVAPTTSPLVAATGTLTTSTSASTQAQVVERQGLFSVELEAIGLPTGSALILAPDSKDICSSGGFKYVSPKLRQGQTVLSLPMTSSSWSDPSNFRGIALVDASGSCFASGGLDWTLPNPRPDLAPEDLGSTDFAEGEVVPAIDGSAQLYVIKAGDTIGAVATRLGLTPDDLVFLNPKNRALQTSELLVVGDGLNLKRATR